MELEPGPFAVREEMPLVPPVFTPGRVRGLVADIQAAHGAIESSLNGSRNELASQDTIGLAVPDGGAIAGAAGGADSVVPGGDNDALGSAVGSGVAIDEDGALQQGNLPGPDEDEPGSELNNPVEGEPAAPSEPTPEPPPEP